MGRQATHTAEEGWIPRGITQAALLACRFPRTVVLLTLFSCVASLVYTFTCLNYHTSRNDLISQGKDYLRRWQQYVAEFGDDEDMVVVVQGKSQEEMKLALDALASRIGQHPQHFDRLFYRVDLAHLKNRALLYLPMEQIRHIQNELRGTRMHMLLDPPLIGEVNPLLSWKSLTMHQLLLEAERSVRTQTNAEVPVHDPFLNQFASICDSASQYLSAPSEYRNPWLSLLPADPRQEETLTRPRYFFSEDGTLAFLLVRPIFREAGSFTSEKACIEVLRGLVGEVKASHPHLEIGLTGLPVLENDEMQASQNDSQRASWLALLGVALLYFVVYRGFRYPLMTVASLLVGTIWALGWTTLTVGHLNILSSAFAVMLIGMGDYGVLWVARYQQESQAGLDPFAATRETALHCGPGILTAACTTALAFFAAMLADLKAVAELGWIAGSGVLLCAIACIVLMPALLALFGERGTGRAPAILSLQEARDQNRTWLPGLVARPRWVLTGALVAGLFLFWWTLGVKYDHNLLHLQAQDLDSVQWEHKLIDHTAGASWHALSYTTTREEALALKRKFEQLPLVSQVVEVASLVPLDQERKIESVRDIQERLRRLPERDRLIPLEPPSVDVLRQTAKRLQAGLSKLILTHPRANVGPLPEKLNALLGRLAEIEPTLAANRLRDFQQNLIRDLCADLHKLRDVATPRPIETIDIPLCLRERYIGQNGKWLLRVFCRECLWEFGPLEAFATQIATVDPDATGKPFTTLEGLRALRSGFAWAGVYALMAMIIVLLIDFGSVKHLMLALLPLGLGLVMTTGLMGLLGIPLNPANLIALPLILGVGADNGVHVVHDYRQRGRGKRYLLNFATGRGILVAALTTILGFGTLLISQHEGLKSLGLVLTLGVSCCMLSSLVFLPCLLSVLSVRAKYRRAETLPFQGKRAA